MQIISSTDTWDLTTRQIDIGLLVSATNTASSSTGSANIEINGQTIATGVTVANKAESNETIDPIGADKSSLTITSIYANITKSDIDNGPITVRVTADESGADLLWCYLQSTSIEHVHTNNGVIEYGPTGNTKPMVSTPNVNVTAVNPIGNVELGGWKTIESGSFALIAITDILGNITV